MSTTTAPTPTAAERAFARFLRTAAGGEILDAAVLGYLPVYELEEIATDHGVSYKTAARAVRLALQEGN